MENDMSITEGAGRNKGSDRAVCELCLEGASSFDLGPSQKCPSSTSLRAVTTSPATCNAAPPSHLQGPLQRSPTPASSTLAPGYSTACLQA